MRRRPAFRFGRPVILAKTFARPRIRGGGAAEREEEAAPKRPGAADCEIYAQEDVDAP